MTVVELLGALKEDQNYRITTNDKRPEGISVKTAAEHNAKVLEIRAVKEKLIEIRSNFKWYI